MVDEVGDSVFVLSTILIKFTKYLPIYYLFIWEGGQHVNVYVHMFTM